ncbi:transcription factor [Lichtheimia corymbifera JMRC:FSU:9682]|uniref:Transcription factor n=1 Tax=Lichtheimia corymbifera JMRC:FSU:9682 TaxID=1263082 RepID=A0A068RNW1_9FUNG|nr:transcription factor [Lichtheimia corymbifera JMRC:FSU:9682]
MALGIVNAYETLYRKAQQYVDTIHSIPMQYSFSTVSGFNADTLVICDKARPPPNLDGGLIALPLTGTAFNRLTMTLQSTIACQTKLALELQNNFVEPLHQHAKNYLKDFKEFRKQHDRALDRYETQLQKYAALSKNKDPTVMRDEAVRLHDARKVYVHLSGQHMMRVVNFRGLLANLLVERFSSNMQTKEAFDELSHVWKDLNSSIGRWKQWLVDDQQTCIYELRKLQQVRERVESEYLQLMQPRKELSAYMGSPLPINGSKSATKPKTQPFSKWGYLFSRISRHTWTRRWCFIYNEHFGWCTVSNKPSRAMVTVEEKISLASCDVKLVTDTDRRYCFEVVVRPSQTSYILQAETDDELRDWISCFQGATLLYKSRKPSSAGHRESMDNQSLVDSFPSSSPSPSSSFTAGSPTRVSPKSRSTTMITAPKDISVTLSGTAPLCHLSRIAHPDDISGLTSKPMDESQWSIDTASAMVMYNSNSLSNYDGMSLITCLSLSPVLVWEAASLRGISGTYVPSTLWGVPWPILGTTLLGERSASLPSVIAVDKTTVSWPLSRDSSLDMTVNLDNYDYPTENILLRQLFGGISQDEVVLDVFIGLLRRHNKNIVDTLNSFDSVSLDSFDQELNSQLAHLTMAPPSEYGYGYAGKAFITQHNLWFYSFSMLAFVNTAVIRLKSIKDIRVVKDGASISNRDHALIVDVLTENNQLTPVALSIPEEDINTVAERLRLAVDNAKSENPISLAELYAKITRISQRHRHRSSSLLSADSLGSPGETRRKKKRLSFRALGASRPSITSRRPMEVIASSTDEKLTINIAPPAQEHAEKPEIVVDDSAVIVSSPAQVASADNGTSEQNKLAVPVESPESESEPEPEPVDPDELPSHISAPDGPKECACDQHLDKVEIEHEFPISAKRLYELMFSDECNVTPKTNGGVWEGKTSGTEGHDLRVTPWEKENDETKRTLKYIMPVSNPIVRMKEAEVVETQVLLKKEDYLCYVVQISTKTAALPYADAFIPSVRYCITWIDKSRCKLTCSLGVAWVKSVFVRGIVTRAAMKAMGENMHVFLPVIQEAADKVAADVEAQRQTTTSTPKKKKSKKRQPQPDESNENIADESSVDTSSVEERKQPTTHAAPVQIQGSKAPITLQPTKQPQASSSEKPRIQLPPAILTNAIQLPRSPQRVKKHKEIAHQQQKEQQQKKQQLQQQSKQSSKQRYATKYVRRIVPYRVAILLLGLILSITCIWQVWRFIRRSNTIAAAYQGSGGALATSTCESSSSSSTREVKMMYLRDIEHGVISNTLHPVYADSESFRMFTAVNNKNNDDGSSRSSNTDIIYKWSSPRYLQAAIDLDLSRDRLASLRHDLLMIFKTLNKMDLDLRESEYVNWLLDSRVHCHRSIETRDHPLPDCHEVIYQLDTLFYKKHKDFMF